MWQLFNSDVNFNPCCATKVNIALYNLSQTVFEHFAIFVVCIHMLLFGVGKHDHIYYN